jgi:pilus assembly protein Flp/PilA
MSTLRKPSTEIAMKKGLSVCFTLLRDESGQDLIEYAVVAGLIGIGAVISMSNLTTKIRTAFGTIGSELTNAL